MEIKANQATQNRPEGDRVIDAPYVFIDIPAVVEQLRSERSWEKNDRNGITVFKSSGLTMVITAVKSGAVLSHQHMEEFYTLQVMQGEIQTETDGKTIQSIQGQVAVFHPDTPHTITALTDSVLMMTTYVCG
jgi:quercetin dioxygenase-like cupin family protein